LMVGSEKIFRKGVVSKVEIRDKVISIFSGFRRVFGGFISASSQIPFRVCICFVRKAVG